MVKAEDKPSQDGRTPKGKFVKGNKCSVGNKGNTMHDKAKALQRVLFDAVGTKSLGKIVKKMVEQAEAGDKDARKECFERLWGKAKQSIEHSGGSELPPITLMIVKEGNDLAAGSVKVIESEVIDAV